MQTTILLLLNYYLIILQLFKCNRKILHVKEKSVFGYCVLQHKISDHEEQETTEWRFNIFRPSRLNRCLSHISLVCYNCYNDDCYVNFCGLQPERGRRGVSAIFLLLLCFIVDREPFENDQKHGRKRFLHVNDVLFRFISFIVDMVSDSCVCLLR